MSEAQLPLNLPVQINSNPLWLNACGWSVAAGFPSPAQDHASKRLDLNDFLIKNRDATFIFRVSGDSMTGVGIYANDTVLVDRSIDPKHGNLVVAVLNTEFTLKRLYKRGGLVKLVPENPIYPHIVIKESDEFQVWGVVTATIRKTW